MALNPALGGVALLISTGVLAHFLVKTTYTVSDGRFLANWSFKTNQPVAATNRAWELRLLDARPEAFDVEALRGPQLDEMYLRSAREDGDRIRKFAGHTVTRMEFPNPYKPGDVLELSTQACTSSSGRTKLEFFVYAPRLGGQDGSSDLLLDVSVDGRNSNDYAIPLRGKDFQRFVLQSGLSANRCHQVSFRLRATTAANRTNSAFAEIWMPRLIPALSGD